MNFLVGTEPVSSSLYWVDDLVESILYFLTFQEIRFVDWSYKKFIVLECLYESQTLSWVFDGLN